jgi:hypothetical protein
MVTPALPGLFELKVVARNVISNEDMKAALLRSQQTTD